MGINHCRTQGRQLLHFASCLWLRLSGTSRMLWYTSRRFPSGDTVGVLVVPHKQSLATQMDRDAGLLNQPGSYWICSRMLRVMLMYIAAALSFLVPFYTRMAFCTIGVDLFICSYIGERFGCGQPLCFTHPGEPSPEAEAPHLPCSWTHQSYVLKDGVWYFDSCASVG